MKSWILTLCLFFLSVANSLGVVTLSPLANFSLGASMAAFLGYNIGLIVSRKRQRVRLGITGLCSGDSISIQNCTGKK